MPSKALVFGFAIMLLVAILVYMVEVFLPVSVKIDFNTICRAALLKMEIAGGMTDAIEDELMSYLYDVGFEIVVVEGTENAKFGHEINLWVEGEYTCSKLQNIFSREEITQRLVYNKTTISRKVLN